jgi:hypothetical protein
MCNNEVSYTRFGRGDSFSGYLCSETILFSNAKQDLYERDMHDN